MNNLTEQDIFAQFIGKPANRDILSQIGRKSYNSEYIISNSKYLYDPKLRDQFGVTDALKEKWEYSGVDFILYITLDGDVITKGHVDKYREVGANARPVIRSLKETQQELRVALRILEFITL